MKKLLILGAAIAALGCASKPAVRERGWAGGELAAVEGDRGLYVADLPAQCPLRRAGIRPGDLLLAVDDEPVADAAGFRDAVRARAPGTRASVRYRRAGGEREAPVRIGRETWRREGTIFVGLWFAPHLDLWPFDDGFDLLGLVTCAWGDDGTEVRVLPLGVAVREEVLARGP